MIYFTGDTHFGHKNICQLSDRPYKSVEEMDEALINNWNKVVGDDDEVYHLGDISLTGKPRTREILTRLKGKIYLIRGNHEKAAMACKSRFEWIKSCFQLHMNEHYFVLFHYPIASWNGLHKGTIHLHGHSHGSYSVPGKIMDVGVDALGYKPISIDAVIEAMNKKEIHSVDHHQIKEKA